MTKYVVLDQNDHGLWSEVGRYDATSAKQAIRHALDDVTEKTGPLVLGASETYVAIPERSFVPEPVALIQPPPRLQFGKTETRKSGPSLKEDETQIIPPQAETRDATTSLA